MAEKNYYTYRTEWSQEDNCYIARVLEFPSLSAFGDTRTEAEAELNHVIEDVTKWMKEDNEAIPEPLSHKEYKGNISLRIPPETHRNVAIMALNEGVSANQYITSLIERNIYCDSISLIINSFEKKLQNYYDNIQKMTLINFELFRRMTLLTDSSFVIQEGKRQNLDGIFPYTKIDEERQLTTI